MKFLPTALLALILFACTPAPKPAPIPPSDINRWHSLFNGDDLDGWQPKGSAVWRVDAKDGFPPMILGTQDGDPKRAGNLVTTAQYQNFDLELEFMIDEHGKYNSGIYLRNPPSGGPNGYQVNIGRGIAGEYCGGLVITDKDNKPIWLGKGDESDTIRKPQDWNSLKIHVDGSHIIVHLNNHEVVNCTDPNPEPHYLQKGVLALQTYGAEGHAGWVKFRNLKIKELPDTSN